MSAEENQATEALTAYCWWRSDLDPTVAEDYWRDVHGTLAARIPGLWTYRQFRLAPHRPAVFDLGGEVDAVRGVERLRGGRSN